MFIRIEYESQYFIEKLNSYIQSAGIDENNLRQSILKTREYSVDLRKKTVTK